MGGRNPLGELRQQLGMGRALLARHTGVAPAQIREVEQGHTPGIPAEILAWAARRGIDTVELDRRHRLWQAGVQRRQTVTALLDRAFKYQRLQAVSRSLRCEPPGTVFQAHRRRASISAAEMARALRVSAATYRAWEAGATSPTVRRAIQASGWSGTAWLLGEADAHTPDAEAVVEHAALDPVQTDPPARYCADHHVSAHPAAPVSLSCTPGSRYQAVSHDRQIRSHASDCAIIAANDAYHAGRYTRAAFEVTVAPISAEPLRAVRSPRGPRSNRDAAGTHVGDAPRTSSLTRDTVCAGESRTPSESPTEPDRVISNCSSTTA